MQVGALRPYEDALRSGAPLALCGADGAVLPLSIARYLAPHDGADDTVLRRCSGPVLDIGCGPGRVVAGLAARGVEALGIDISEVAVAMTRRTGAAAVRGDVFDEVPGEGLWQTAVLLDGNIGIGGDVDRTLTRVFEILAPEGRLVAELDRDDYADLRGPVHFLDGADDLPRVHFLWARLGVAALCRRARGLGLRVSETWRQDGRSFATVARLSR